MRPGAVLMAAGASRRFGENKLLLPYEGRPAVAHAMRALACAGVSPVAVVTGYPEIAAIAERYGFLAIENAEPEAGVSRTIRLGLSALLAREPGLPGCLFAVGDQPRLSGESVQGLIAAWAEEPDAIYALAAGEKRGNPVVFPHLCFPRLLALQGDTGGSAVIREERGRLRLYQAVDPMELMDGDTPEAWKELIR